MSCKSVVRDILNLPDKVEIYENFSSVNPNIRLEKYYLLFYKHEKLEVAFTAFSWTEAENMIEFISNRESRDFDIIYSKFLENLVKEIKSNNDVRLIKTLPLNQ